jgi:hypothetical protein
VSPGGSGRSWALTALAVLASLAACAHAREVEPVEPRPEEGATPSTSIRGVSRDERTGIPIASTPGALLKPGAARLIQERLARAGALRAGHTTERLDAATFAALARYQKAHDLPATGQPDGATIDKLGLSADDVFVSGQ